MNKEEILAKSKQENRGQDIANLEVSKASMQFGWITAVCLLSLVAVVEAVVYPIDRTTPSGTYSK